MTASVESARREIARLVDDPPPGPWLVDAAVTALGRLIGHDGYCLFGVDPATGLRSVMFSRHGLTVPTERLMHNETVEPDANRYADLLAAPVKAGILTARRTPHSARLHEILPVDGYRSELRAVLTTPGGYWGAVSLFRDDPHRPFTDDDAAAADALAAGLASALRRYQVGGRPTDVAGTRRPVGGIVCLDATGAIVGMDADAQAWLDSLANSWEEGVVPEDVLRCVHEVAAAARHAETAELPGHPALTRTRIADGRWMVAIATRVGGSEVDTVVQLRSGDVATVLPAFAAWCGLSERETHVLSLLLRGLAAKQVARRLGISVLTVGDHQRAIYRKAHVRGRDELLSLLV
jgi:DNA-binding CsgD family transcriptional regulator